MSIVVKLLRHVVMPAWCFGVSLLACSWVLLTCSEKHVAEKQTITPDNPPAALKIETSNKGSTIVTLKVSILDADGKLITKGVYASSALKFKHRCGSAEMVIDEQYAIKGIAQILFHRAVADCVVSVEYSNLGESLLVAKIERDDDDTPIADPITLKIVDTDGTAITSASKFTRIGIRTVGVHLTYADEENKSQLGQIHATVRLMCDYDNDATYEKQLCIGRMKPNIFGVAAGILAGDDADDWDSNGDGHRDGNEKCYANVFAESCQLEAQVDIIVGGKGKIKETQEFQFHALGLKLTSLGTNSQVADGVSRVKRGLTVTTAVGEDYVWRSVRVYPTEDGKEFTARELDAFRPLLKTVLVADGSIQTSRAPKHNLNVRIGVAECSYGTGPNDKVIYRKTSATLLTHANPHLPAADYDSKPVGLAKGEAYATFFATPEGWYHLAWDRLVKYATGTPDRAKHGPGVMPVDNGNNKCDGKCFTGNPLAANANCQCTTGKPACLIDPDGADLAATPPVLGNCNADAYGYTCKDTRDNEQCGTSNTSKFIASDNIYKQTDSCTILVEMSRGVIEAPDALPVCSDDLANKDSCYGKSTNDGIGYDDLSTLQPAEDGKFCSQGMCLPPLDTGVTDKAKQRRIAQTCALKDTPAKPATWTHGTADADWLKCEELIAIRKRVDSWHTSPAWAKSTTIIETKTINIDN